MWMGGNFLNLEIYIQKKTIRDKSGASSFTI